MATRDAALDRIPEHLAPFIAKQDPALYTPMDHASWRYILRISRAYFERTAHPKYLRGLEETGISTDRIPLISEMDAKLRRFGWRAVPVVGFIPPAVFMELQSLGVLAIACDMRQIEHLAYTPAPDIVHEAAGHAPIIADPDYAKYLRAYGEVARKAIFSKQDMDLYRAIRTLSDTKENPDSTDKDVKAAQYNLDMAVAGVGYVSEATYLARMNWWTVEYGLVGDLKNPRIYGAGLLSSVGESFHCLSDQVKKIPFTLDCLNVPYDITKPQPQLFVAKDFAVLGTALEEFAETMAFRRGGLEGLAKARMAEATTTSVLDSGIQISGILSGFQVDSQGVPSYLQFSGPVQLSTDDQEIPGHGAETHRQGFGTPVGFIAGTHKSAADLSEAELQKGEIRFESGVIVRGKFRSRLTREKDGFTKNILAAFHDCTVTLGDEVLFRPEWGVYDMACGSQVESIFGNAADRAKFMRATGELNQRIPEPKTNLTPENRDLNALYERMRTVRADPKSKNGADAAEEIYSALKSKFDSDWLLRMELLEFIRASKLAVTWENDLRTDLDRIGKSDASKAELIRRGLALI